MIHHGKWIFSLAGLVSLAGLCGCGGAYRTAPTLGFGTVDVRANLARTDIVIEDSVEGTSEDTLILGGFIEIVDKTNVAVCGIKFFKDKTGFADEKGNPVYTVQGRAYYKALEQAPDADTVLQKSSVNDASGIPFLYSTDTCTFLGKAIKLRADNNRSPQ